MNLSAMRLQIIVPLFEITIFIVVRNIGRVTKLHHSGEFCSFIYILSTVQRFKKNHKKTVLI